MGMGFLLTSRSELSLVLKEIIRAKGNGLAVNCGLRPNQRSATEVEQSGAKLARNFHFFAGGLDILDFLAVLDFFWGGRWGLRFFFLYHLYRGILGHEKQVAGLQFFAFIACSASF